MINQDAPFVLGGGVVLSSVFLVSTYVGFSRVSACNDETSDRYDFYQRELARKRLQELRARESAEPTNPTAPPPNAAPPP